MDTNYYEYNIEVQIKCDGRMGTGLVADNRGQRQALLNTVIKLRFVQLWGTQLAQPYVSASCST